MRPYAELAPAPRPNPPGHPSAPLKPGRTGGLVARWLLVALILLAFGRGIWALGGKTLWWDESLSLIRAQQDLPTLLSNEIVLTDTIHEVTTVDAHPPLFFLALWLTLRLFGTTEFALRFLSLACVVIIVPLLYATGRRLVGREVGLAAAALAAFSPLYLWYGQELRMYAMLAVLSLLSFYCLVRAFFSLPARPVPRLRRRWMAAYVLASACVVATHYNGALLIAFELLVLGLVLLRQPKARRALILVIAALAAFVTLALGYVWYHMTQTGSLSIVAAFVPLRVLARDLLNSFSLGLSVDVADWYVLAADLFFLLFVVLGLARLVRPGASRRWRAAGWFLAGYLLVPFLLLYLGSYVRPVYNTSRHLILSSPPFYLLAAAGLTWGLDRGRPAVRKSAVSLLGLGWLVAMVGMGYSTYNYFVDPAYGKDPYREWGAYLRAHVRPGDVVVLSSPHSAELYRYYADSGVPWIGLPLLRTRWPETEAKLEALLQSYDRVWLAVSDNTPDGWHHKSVEQWLDRHAFRTDYQLFAQGSSSLPVACYLPAWPSVKRLPSDALPAQASYESALQLEGYRLVSPPTSGRMLHVQLFWAVQRTAPEQALVSLRLVDKQGNQWGQSQQCPFNGLYPMWQWQAGLLLRDELEILIPPGTPPGTYELEMRLIDQPGGCLGESGQYLSPLTATNRRGDGIVLGEVQVERPDTPPTPDQLDAERSKRARLDGLELLSARIGSSELRPGEPVDIVLNWQALEGALEDHRFRLRLVDSEGQVWQDADIRPAGPEYPTDRWQAGDRFQGRFRLWLPENAQAGRYWIELVPTPPLRPRGIMATVRNWLSPGDPKLRLATLHVAIPSVPTDSPLPPVPTGLSISHPMLATLGDEVRFLGFDLSSDSVRAGEPLSVTLFWQALRPMDIDYTVFVHLLDGSNLVVGQKDSMPGDDTYLTSAWQPGQVITDVRTVMVDPATAPGSLVLEAGMYRLETLKRLPVRDANSRLVPGDRILLSQVTVTEP